MRHPDLEVGEVRVTPPVAAMEANGPVRLRLHIDCRVPKTVQERAVLEVFPPVVEAKLAAPSCLGNVDLHLARGRVAPQDVASGLVPTDPHAMGAFGQAQHETLLRSGSEPLENDMDAITGRNGNSVREPESAILVLNGTNGP